MDQLNRGKPSLKGIDADVRADAGSDLIPNPAITVFHSCFIHNAWLEISRYPGASQ
jgi:hypothetical protein